MFTVERTANIKDNPLQMEPNTLAKRSANCSPRNCPKGLVFLTFWPLIRKLKENFLCNLGDLSEAGGDYMFKKL
ncbi:hypothetical protein D1BOALGB6SA_1680 [Olavius sp. associated proteobacterium Delta 1]|nr:hypothetical protein D1BOALGB6SA_1680 [Olavius sp. associated proteobacterium Delta 1]